MHRASLAGRRYRIFLWRAVSSKMSTVNVLYKTDLTLKNLSRLPGTNLSQPLLRKKKGLSTMGSWSNWSSHTSKGFQGSARQHNSFPPSSRGQASTDSVSARTHVFSPQSCSHHFPWHVHQIDISLSHFSVVRLHCDFSWIFVALADPDYVWKRTICKSTDQGPLKT